MARRPLALLSLFCLSLLSLTHAEEKPCTGHHAGKYYDLNSLQSAKDAELKTPEGHEMVLSACKSVSHETWGLKVEDPGLVGGFVRRAHGDFSMGRTSTTLSFSGRAGHPHITLASGSKCLDSEGKMIENLRGSTEIEFICDPSAGTGSPRLVAQLPPGGDEAVCAWVFEWRTAVRGLLVAYFCVWNETLIDLPVLQAACPTSEGVTFGGIIWFLFISALIFLLIYLVLGTLHNYFVLGLAGTDALPRFSLSSMLYHGREAWGMAGEWWASGRGGGFNLSSSARGPVGLGGPGGFPSSNGRDPERGGPRERAFGGANGNSGSGGANPFIRTSSSVRKEQPAPQTNPASHQTQVMGPPPGAMPSPMSLPPPGMSMPAPMAMPSPGLQAQGGLNPASHQAQLMAGMPVPHLAAPAPAQQTNENATAYRDAPAPAPAPVPVPMPASARRETFAVGDDEGDEDDAPEIQIADVRGRVDAGGDGGSIRL
ncbi:hypothetical protein B0H19DRAFT_1374200 [Mycena capillaripes]|nr:hypothetical protein B0H19DRAFT_1374200 [Mycena capillaripes]